MSVTLGLLDTISLLGALQGFFLAGVLLTKRTNRTANRLLAVLMVTFSLYLTSQVYYAAGWMELFPHYFGVSNPLPLVFGPLVYLYAVFASDRGRPFRMQDLLHFALPVAVVIATLPIYLRSGPDKIEFYRQLQLGDAPLLLRVIDWLKYASGLTYSVATIRHLVRHRARVMDSYSNVERVNLRWLLWLAGGAAVIWVVASSAGMAEGLDIEEQLESMVSLGIAIMVYAIGYMGLRQPEVFNYATAEYPAVMPSPTAEAAAPGEPPARYERSGLGEAEAAVLRESLLQVMERDRPYQDSELTLADLAERLRTTPHKLSEVLSQVIGVTFYDFVNRYRVEDVRRRVADERSRHLTLLALALDAGFASKSTFNNVFKKHTGQTPSAYRRALAV